jgi:hypothetical protein
MRHIICMLVKNSGDNDLFESSGALFRKLAPTRAAIVYGFLSASYRSYTEATPQALLKSKHFTADEDDEIALYINAHGTGGKIADGEAGAVAKKIIDVLGIRNRKIVKIVFLACKLQGAENVEISLSKILTKLAGYDVHKIVIYKSVMTILSPRNLKFIEKIPKAQKVAKPKGMSTEEWRSGPEAAAKALEEEKVERAKKHLTWYATIVAEFKADLEKSVDKEESVTAFFQLSGEKWDEATPAALWDTEGATPRTDIAMNAQSMHLAKHHVDQLHTTPFDHRIWGRRVLVDKKPGEKAKIMLTKHWGAVTFDGSPLSHTQGNVTGPQAYEGCNGHVYTESDGLKIVWELNARQ